MPGHPDEPAHQRGDTPLIDPTSVLENESFGDLLQLCFGDRLLSHSAEHESPQTPLNAVDPSGEAVNVFVLRLVAV